jgi:hypothetical protein
MAICHPGTFPHRTRLARTVLWQWIGAYLMTRFRHGVGFETRGVNFALNFRQDRRCRGGTAKADKAKFIVGSQRSNRGTLRLLVLNLRRFLRSRSEYPRT